MKTFLLILASILMFGCSAERTPIVLGVEMGAPLSQYESSRKTGTKEEAYPMLGGYYSEFNMPNPDGWNPKVLIADNPGDDLKGRSIWGIVLSKSTHGTCKEGINEVPNQIERKHAANFRNHTKMPARDRYEGDFDMRGSFYTGSIVFLGSTQLMLVEVTATCFADAQNPTVFANFTYGEKSKFVSAQKFDELKQMLESKTKEYLSRAL